MPLYQGYFFCGLERLGQTEELNFTGPLHSFQSQKSSFRRRKLVICRKIIFPGVKNYNFTSATMSELKIKYQIQNL